MKRGGDYGGVRMAKAEWKPAKLDELGFVGCGKSRYRPRSVAILYGRSCRLRRKAPKGKAVVRFPAHAAVCVVHLKSHRNPLAHFQMSGYTVPPCSGLPPQRKTPTTQYWKNASGTRQTNSGPGRGSNNPNTPSRFSA